MPELEQQQSATQTGGTETATGTAGTQNPGAAGTPAAASTQATAATTAQPTGFTYTEDRSRWIPPHRLNEESQKRTRIEAELETSRRQIQALTGAQPQDPNAQKQEQVREAFFQMFPQMKKFASLTDQQIEQLLQAPQGAQRATQLEQREWQRHGQAQLTTIFGSVADAIGADELNADQKSDLKTAFGSWLEARCKSELQASGGETSETLKRYEAGDAKLLNEFTQRYVGAWIEPARRKVTAQTLTRTRPVVNSAGRSQVTQTTKPEKFNSLDERIEYASKIARERGAFGGQ